MNGTIPQKFLPLGTVCKLKGGQKYIMVSGFGAVNVEEKKIYDYMGVVYPEGQIASNVSLMFDHDQVVEIAHMGFSNQENVEFQKELAEYMNNNVSDIIAKLNEADEMPGAAANEGTAAPVEAAIPEMPVIPQMPAAPSAPTAPAAPAPGVIAQPLTAPTNTENN